MRCMCCCSGIWRCQFPDLNQLDFYLWDDIICEVYNNEIQNQEELVDYMEGSATLIQKVQVFLNILDNCFCKEQLHA